MSFLYDQLFQYYGADWLATICTIIWLIMIGDKKRVSFIFAIIASVCWFIFAILTNSMVSMFANGIFIILNIRGYIKWGTHVH